MLGFELFSADSITFVRHSTSMLDNDGQEGLA